ncbi:MAG: acyltransferase family protein [Thermodesulfobacteriota bacterium]
MVGLFCNRIFIKKITDKFQAKDLILPFFIMWPITYIMGMFHFFHPYDIDLNMQIFSCTAFLIIYKFNRPCRLLNLICTHIGRASFSIYLSHVFFIILFEHIFPKNNYFLYTVIGFIFVLSGSYLLYFATKILTDFFLHYIKTITKKYNTRILWQTSQHAITKVFHLSYFK